MALAGQQTVHLVATVDGERPTGQSPFPPCGVITTANPFPQSPTPAYVLLTQNIIGGPYLYTPGAYIKGNCAIDVQYSIGQTRMQSTIIVSESVATVQGAL